MASTSARSSMSTDRSERARLTRVSLSYGQAPGSNVTALEQVDLCLEAGCLTALVGPNGSGKSSILAVLAGRVEPQVGEVSVAGLAAPALLRGRSRRALHAAVSFVSQDAELDPEMGVGETLQLLATLYGVRPSDRPARVARLLDDLDLASHRHKRVRDLSGGLRRRLHIAGALMHAPQVLLLDEPGAGLDDQGRQTLWTMLARLATSGTAILVITHDLAAVESHAHDVIVMEAGRVSQQGTPAELAEGHPHLAAALRSRIGEPPAPRPAGGNGRRGRA